MYAAQEEAWNCFPYAKTIINHPSFTKFGIEIVTIHAPAKRDSSGKIMYEDNIHGLTGDVLKQRKVRNVRCALGCTSSLSKMLEDNNIHILTFALNPKP